jgi:hypothetical protein
VIEQTLRPQSREFRDALGDYDRASLGMDMEAVIAGVLGGSQLGGSGSGGRRDGS